MCDEHDINIDVETNKKDKQTINQIDGWNIEVKFNENGFSLENLVEEYIKEKFSVY
ncbi:TPA: aminoacyl-tRNA hydrolase [Streptococcus pyogenes]|jgi:aminoacyl-tRNA hydrolase|uniref:aminoacyl-tRNA hydrolase n=1 Tax=uncultured Parvimonas sp. TaxID=747372 RepID=UPI0028D313C2|nr:aminoacyl-tRNA hydrolase [uncultured Parvimonas sp.]HER1058006.1 aminoacyl-tRNA hydrolase [Streptococcus pyogenes]